MNAQVQRIGSEHVIRFGIGMVPCESFESAITLAKLADDLGYWYYGVSEYTGDRDLNCILAACALNTKKIKMGPCVTNPYIRPPGLTARLIATVDEMSSGRAMLGLGVGAEGFEEYGLKAVKPVEALRDTVHIVRSLLAGKKVEYEGKVFKIRGAKMNFETKDVPIQIYSRSPKVLELSGEIADMAVIATYASEDGIKYAREQIKKGEQRRSKDMRKLELASWIYVSIADDRRIAIEDVKPFAIAMAMSTAPEVYPIMGIGEDVARSFRDIMARKDLSYSEKTVEAAKLMTDDMVEKFTVAGTAEDVASKIKRIVNLGINYISFLPFSAPGKHTGSWTVVRSFAEKVMPEFEQQ
jgi:5,10-methylenetetrahydromethanopterin reductase